MFNKYTVMAWLLSLWPLLAAPVVLAETAPETVATPAIQEPPVCAWMRGAPSQVAEAVAQLQGDRRLPDSWPTAPWIDGLLVELGAVASHGLESRHYRRAELQQLRERLSAGDSLDDCAAAGVLRPYLTALRDLRFGRVNPERHQLMWYAGETPQRTPVAELVTLALDGLNNSPADAFAAAPPELPQYQQLRQRYNEARSAYPDAWTLIPPGLPLLRPGDEEYRVPLIKRRLREGGFLPQSAADAVDDALFTPELATAVKTFQRRHGLQEDGVVGPRTIAELNIQPAARLAQLRANLERLRWYARDREDNLLLVDIAGAQVSYYRQGVLAMTTRAQAGTPERETPPLKSLITHVTLNPSWIVPPTILRKDVLPAVRQDIGYLAKRRLRVFDGDGQELNPARVNWANPGKIRLRQDPGPEAALGQVAIRFPNPFAVFLHDTPNQRLFATSSRFYSSGCVRVESAMTLTDLLFDGAPQPVLDRKAETLASGKTRNVNLAAPVPLLMVYWTATVDAEGQLAFRPDIYQRDETLLALLSK